MVRFSIYRKRRNVALCDSVIAIFERCTMAQSRSGSHKSWLLISLWCFLTRLCLDFRWYSVSTNFSHQYPLNCLERDLFRQVRFCHPSFFRPKFWKKVLMAFARFLFLAKSRSFDPLHCTNLLRSAFQSLFDLLVVWSKSFHSFSFSLDHFDDVLVITQPLHNKKMRSEVSLEPASDRKHFRISLRFAFSLGFECVLAEWGKRVWAPPFAEH
jgi:hypothetical protein